MRQVIEFRRDGSYTSGICLTATQMGWCQSGGATAIASGEYRIQGDTLILERGLVFGADADGVAQTLRWKLETVAGASPTGPPPSKRLHLFPDAEGRSFSDMEVEPGWR